MDRKFFLCVDTKPHENPTVTFVVFDGEVMTESRDVSGQWSTRRPQMDSLCDYKLEGGISIPLEAQINILYAEDRAVSVYDDDGPLYDPELPSERSFSPSDIPSQLKKYGVVGEMFEAVALGATTIVVCTPEETVCIPVTVE